MTTLAPAASAAALRRRYRLRSLSTLPTLILLLTGCANPALRDADQLMQAGQHEAALTVLRSASSARPDDYTLRAALAAQQERSLLMLAAQAESARAAGQFDAADALVQRMEVVDANAPRTRSLKQGLERARRHRARLVEAAQLIQQGQLDAARAIVQQVLAEDPGQPDAASLQQRLRARYAPPPVPSGLAEAFQKPIGLEFRDAPLRTVFEAMGRGAGINFVFDKDVRGDAKVTVYLKDVSVDEAMRVILSSQQLDRQLLNDRTVLIYPNTPAKQREHQELVTRSFYLNNADVKQAQALVKMMAKTRDLFIDERLNLLVARDTPEVIAMIDQLVASLDLPEPEVMLDVEVLEIDSGRGSTAGINLGVQAQYGLPLTNLGGTVGGTGGNSPTFVPWSSRGGFITQIANPAITAQLTGSAVHANTLASPKLRTRNKEKAKIQIGDKVPIFTSTATANVGVSSTVTYLDVGIKLEVEPQVQLDNDVVLKLNLEVSTLGAQQSSGGATPTQAYTIGSRNATTSLRLRDGETQVLAGLIKDEDTRNIAGLPYLSEAPLIGRLFGVHTTARNKTEIVLLITPHVLRNLDLPDASRTIVPSGFDNNPGAEGVRLKPRAAIALPLGTGGGGTAYLPPPRARPQAAAPTEATVQLQTSGSVTAGDTLSVTLQNGSAATVRGDLQFDAQVLAPADGSASASNSGRIAVELAPGGQQVLVLRAKPGIAAGTTQIEFSGATAQTAQGESLTVQVEGDGNVVLRAKQP